MGTLARFSQALTTSSVMFTFLLNLFDGQSSVFLHFLSASALTTQRLTNWFGNDWDYKDCSAAYNGKPNLLGDATCNKLGELKDSGSIGAGIDAITTKAMKRTWIPANY